MYRARGSALEVLLVHPGGPFFRNKDAGVWTIPKGEPEPGEDLLAVAVREFREETGFEPTGPYLELTPVKQAGGKWVHAWAFAGDCDPTQIRSNVFTIEWPRGSGRKATFPEVDRADFFDLPTARKKIHPAQAAFLDELATRLART